MGKTAKVVVMKTEPVIESGVSKVYGTMVEGFDLGVKGVKGLTSKMTKSKRRRHR